MKSKNAPARAGFAAVHLLSKLPIALAALLAIGTVAARAYLDAHSRGNKLMRLRKMGTEMSAYRTDVSFEAISIARAQRRFFGSRLAAAIAVLTCLVALSESALAYDRVISPQMLWSAGMPARLPGCSYQPPDSKFSGGDPAEIAKGLVADFNANCTYVSYCQTRSVAIDYEVGPEGYGGQSEPGLFDFGKYEAHATIHVVGKDCQNGGGSFDSPWIITVNQSCASGGSNERYDPATEKCVCKTGWVWVPQGNDGNCAMVRDTQRDDPKACPANGNPIYPLTGAKRQTIDIDVGLVMPLRLTYDMRNMLPGNTQSQLPAAPYSFGRLWGSSFHRQIVKQGTGERVIALRGDGVAVSFETLNGKYSSHSGSDAGLTSYGSYKYQYVDRSGLYMERVDNDSSPPQVQIAKAQGDLLTYGYSSGPMEGVAPVGGLLISVTDQFGRSVNLNYEQPLGQVLRPRIYRVFDVAGREIKFGYDSIGNLTSITWPDGKVKQFVYERADLPWALTGVVDEDNKRFATFEYDQEGRAVSTEHGVGVDKHSVRWSTPPRWSITDVYQANINTVWREHAWTQAAGVEVKRPLGTWAALGSLVINGMPRQTSRDQPGGSGCGGSTSEQTQDSRGNVLSRLDFGEAGANRHRSCYAFPSDRNTEIYRVEGLMETDGCPPDLAAYQISTDLPADKPQRKITTEWHPVWNLEVRRAEPKLITTTIYNGEKDPPVTGTPVYCVDGDPKLLDGTTRLAAVCRRYEQSTQDETGNLGFSAAATSTRSWSYQYNQNGQLRQETDPRGKLTKKEYYLDTVFEGVGEAARGHQKGDLQRATNALQQATDYLEFNKRGQPLTIKYANGSQEQREYHVRGWLTKVTLVPAGSGVGQVTQYDYYDTGLLKKVTQPDGSYASYTWDDAHRLIEVSDSLGNKVTYKLDNAGNRETETFADKNGVLAKTISRTFDALGRLSSSTGLQ